LEKKDLESTIDYYKNELEELKSLTKKKKVEDEIRKVYLKILEREPDKEGLQFHSNQILQNAITISQLEPNFKNSEEFQNLQYKKDVLNKYSSKVIKPIFITGVPRSGTSLIYQILYKHPQVAWFSNEDLQNWIPNEQQYYLKIYYEDLKKRGKKIPITEHSLLVIGREVFKDNKNFPSSPNGPFTVPIEGEIFWISIFGNEYITDVPIESKIKLTKEIANLLAKRKKERFLNKAPQNCMRFYAIQKIFSDAKFINIHRDPIEVISSMIRRHKKEGKFSPGIQIKNQIKYDELNLIEKFSWLYKEITESILDFSKSQNSDTFLNVKYSELISNPSKVVKEIISFSELELPESIDRLIPPIIKNTREEVYGDITKEDEKKIFQIVKPIS